MKAINDLTKEPEVGDTYTGKVVKTTQFGAFVELKKGTDGLLHVSNVGPGRVGHIEDVINRGDVLDVIVQEVDKDRGRIGLKLVAKHEDGSLVQPEELIERAKDAPERPREERPPRRDGGDRRRGRGGRGRGGARLGLGEGRPRGRPSLSARRLRPPKACPSTSPRDRADARPPTACARLWTSSFVRIRWMWPPTVLGLMTSASAISGWLWPRARSRSTSRFAHGRGRAESLRRGSSGLQTAADAAKDHAARASKLVVVEGFHDVVVGSDEKPGDPVGRRRPLAREEDDSEISPPKASRSSRHTS